MVKNFISVVDSDFCKSETKSNAATKSEEDEKKKRKKMSRKKRLRAKNKVLTKCEMPIIVGDDQDKKAESRMKASRFRFINEQLYTQSSTAAIKLFTEDPNAFEAYHSGYKQQVFLQLHMRNIIKN